MLSILSLALFFAVSSALSVQSTANDLVIVRQDQSRNAFIELYNGQSGAVNTSSNVATFQFGWPLIEMTTNTKDKQVYIITYPDSAPGPVLFHLDNHLQIIQTYDKVTFSYFDLQYSALQSTLYGIYVSSTYGRVLSNFTINPSTKDIGVTQLFTLPYMWYVNASTFHTETNTYYALINNFPGQPNSTLDQQLIVADFSKDISVAQPKVNVYPIHGTVRGNPILVQFIGFSHQRNSLYFAGTITTTSTGATSAVFGKLDTASGTVKSILWEIPAAAVGPLVIDDRNEKNAAFLFVQNSARTAWNLHSIPLYQELPIKLIHSYPVNTDLKVFAAGSIGFQ